jgi:tetratricopeptide (TPR) repeat protein
VKSLSPFHLVFLTLCISQSALLLGQSYREIAQEAAMRGDNEMAVEFYEKALVSAAKVFKEEDIELVMRRAELGEAYRAVGRWKEAITNLDYAWKRARFDAEVKQRWSEQEGEMAMNCGEKLARACQADSRYGDAVMVFRTAIADNFNAKRPSDEAVHFHALLADNLLLLKRDSEAEEAVRKAVEITEQAQADNPRALSRVLSLLGNLFFFHERYSLARPLYERAVVLAAQHLPPDDEDRIVIQSRLGTILLKENKLDEASLLLEDSLRNLLRSKTPDSNKTVPLYLSLSELATRRAQPEQALQQAEEALRICKLHYSESHPDFARALGRIGSCQLELKQTDQAKFTLTRALGLMTTSLGKDNPQTVAMQKLVETLAR